MARLFLLLPPLALAALLAGCLSDSPETAHPGPDLNGPDTTAQVDTPTDTTDSKDTVSTSDTTYVPGPIQVHPTEFWPLAVGNTWHYSDTTRTSGGGILHAGSMALSILSSRADSAGVWWRFKSTRTTAFWSATTYFEMRQDVDTLFVREDTARFFGMDFQLRRPSADSTGEVKYWNLPLTIPRNSVRAAHSTNVFSSPAGTFSGLVRFIFWESTASSSSMQDLNTFELKPGVGMVRLRVQVGGPAEQGFVSDQRLELVSYTLAL